MPILQNILLSLFAVSCASNPVHQPSDSQDNEPPEEHHEQQAPSVQTPRELFKQFFEKEYPVAVQNGYIYQSLLPLMQGDRQIVYRLEHQDVRLYLYPGRSRAVALPSQRESQQYEHEALVRDFFKEDITIINNIQDAQSWIKWVEGFLYQADVLVKKEDALQFFHDEDRLLVSINPFFYVDYDGRYYRIDYFTMQDNTLWQKRITLTSYGVIAQFQQDFLDLERRGAL